MNATADLSFVSLVSNASVVVQLIMLLLLLGSIYSWFTIFRKTSLVRRVGRQSKEFEKLFWSGSDLGRLHQQVTADPDAAGISRIFDAGFKEYAKIQKQGGMEAHVAVDSIRRAMHAARQREMDWLEASLDSLATVGSVSPYVGLFGTVWGIMTAFRGLANVGQATLAHVAPGIAEALVATAMGLFAAIPAVVAYNRFTHDIDRLDTRFEAFMEEFSNILQRQVTR